jgi:hypothetical protein
MKIGFLNLFPMRPHSEYMAYLSSRLGEDHEVNILSCFNDFSSCHYKLWNDHHGISTCIKCKAGSLSLNQNSKNVTKINSLKLESYNECEKPKHSMVINSIANIKRIEKSEQLDSLTGSVEYDKLTASKEKMSKVTRAWVTKENFDVVLIFNGRMDLMDSALREIKAMKVPFYTLESSNTNVGIRIQEGVSCVNHDNFEENLLKFINYPLTKHQTTVAYSFYYNRLKNLNNYEWRHFEQNKNYNLDVSLLGKYILVLPSSMYEFHGLLDGKCEWNNPLEGFDLIVKKFRNNGYNIVFRFHPNWAKKVGKYSSNAQEDYLNYCKSNNFIYFDSSSKVPTRELIKSTSLVLVNGGSSAIEACLMLKQVINIYPAKFNVAGFLDLFTKNGNIPKVVSNEMLKIRRRYCLRYLYFNMRMYPSLQKFIKPISSLDYKYNYLDKLDITDILNPLNLSFEDYEGGSEIKEDIIINMFDNKKNDELDEMYVNLSLSENKIYDSFHSMKTNTKIIKIINKIRQILPKGD